MFILIRQHPGGVALILLLHVLLFAALLMNVTFFAQPLSAPALQFRSEPVDVIEATAVDLETFERIERDIRVAEQERIAEQLRVEEEARREVERQRQAEVRRQQEEQRQREAQERARQEALQAAEQARRDAEAERARAQAERAAAEEARREAEQARKAQEEREARERREREAAEKRRAEEEARRRETQARELEEQRRRQQMEAERQALASAQAARDAAARRAELDAARSAYIAEVQATVQRRWRQPAGLQPGNEAFVLVRINAETGRILNFSVQSCSGSAAFCESVRQTMDRLQSLPRPPDAEAVRGGIRIRFVPD